MAKKRLVDLLEEAQSAGSDTEATQAELDPNQTLAEDTTLSDMNSHPETEQNEQSEQNTSTEARSKRTGPTKAELETTVSELKEALAASQQKETQLLKQIAELKSDMKDLKRVIQSLHTDMEAAEELKTELEEAKEVIRGLSQANLASAKTASSKPAESLQLQVRAKKLPSHSIEAGSLPKMSSERLGTLPQMSSDAGAGMLSDADIGWVD